MTDHTQSSRATVDVINFWCVVVLIVSAASVAGVVGAAVIAGEFEHRNFNADMNNGTGAGVLIEEQPDGTASVRWSEKGEALFLEIRVDGKRVTALNYVGDEVTVEKEQFQVVAIYQDQSTAVVETYGREE